MKIINNYFNNAVKVIQINKFEDTRGFFSIPYNKEEFQKIDIDESFYQDNFSFSKNKNTIRGIHFQNPPYEQSKLISVIKGSIFDVFVDLRSNSSTYGKSESVILDRNDLVLYISKGFGHAFCTLIDNTLIHYKVSNRYDLKSEETIIWNDIDLNILWPNFKNKITMSDKDLNGIKFNSFKSNFRIK